MFALFLSGCPVGPDFVKPDPAMPENYRSELEPAEAASFADLPFWDVFNDGTLRDLIQEALANNYDLQTAIYNVEAAQHQVGITRSPLFPAGRLPGRRAAQSRLHRPRVSQHDDQHLPRRVHPGLGDRHLGPHPPRHRVVEGADVGR